MSKKFKTNLAREGGSPQSFTTFLYYWHADIRALNIEYASLTDVLVVDPADLESLSRLSDIRLIFSMRKKYRQQFYPTMYIIDDHGEMLRVSGSKAAAWEMVGEDYEG